MSRFWILVRNEMRMFRTAVPFHIIAIIQPAIMYILMSIIMIEPTFDMAVHHPLDDMSRELVATMREVGSPVGAPYINPVLVEIEEPLKLQVISVEEINGRITAVQTFGLVDSNIVKNFRNRLTATGLVMWNDALGDSAVLVKQYPWLPRDMPFTLFLGIGLLPTTVFLASAVLGGILTAQDFEYQTILEYRLSPVSPLLILAGRLARLVLLSLFAACLLILAIGMVTGVWPDSLFAVLFILIPLAIITGALGITIGLLTRQVLQSFVITLALTFSSWLMGSAFGLAAGFGRIYEQISRLGPNTPTVELLFPQFFDVSIGGVTRNIMTLALLATISVSMMMLVYRRRVLSPVR